MIVGVYRSVNLEPHPRTTTGSVFFSCVKKKGIGPSIVESIIEKTDPCSFAQRICHTVFILTASAGVGHCGANWHLVTAEDHMKDCFFIQAFSVYSSSGTK